MIIEDQWIIDQAIASVELEGLSLSKDFKDLCVVGIDTDHLLDFLNNAPLVERQTRRV